LTSAYKDEIYQRCFTEEEYDDYLLNTPLEYRFDYTTIELAVVEAFPKHAAYGMTFQEYVVQRTRFSEYDPSEKKQMCFYFQKFPARVASDLALLNKLPLYPFVILMAELGLIHFHVDYHHEYSLIRDGRKAIFTQLTNVDAMNSYQQLDKQTIELGTGTGARKGKASQFNTSTPKWLYNAISDTATYLNMSISDFVYLCWCIAAKYCLDNDQIPIMVAREIDQTCQQFDFEFKHYGNRIESILTDMKQSNH